MTTTAILPRFPFVGLIFSSRVDALTRQGVFDPIAYVRRHICGDWADVRKEHQRHNSTALARGGYLLSSYAISENLTLRVFTEADRSHTTVFLHAEYYPS